MKIIIYNNLVYGGGVERLLPIFAESLKNRGHDITVMASPDNKKEFETAFPQKYVISARDYHIRIMIAS